MPTPNSYTPQDDPFESADSVDVKSIIASFRERAWIIVLCVVAAGFMAFGYIKRTEPKYEARAILEVEQSRHKPLGNVVEAIEDDPRGEETVKTVEKTLQTTTLLSRVVATNNLAKDSAFVGLSDGGVAPTEGSLVRKLSRMIEVKVQPGTRLINIIVESTSPVLAQKLANSLVIEFKRLELEQRATVNTDTYKLLEAQELRLRHELAASEKALQEYTEENRWVGDEDTQHILEREKDLAGKIATATAESIRLLTASKEAANLGQDVPRLLTISSVAKHPDVLKLVETKATQEAAFDKLKQRYKHLHPKYLAAEQELIFVQIQLSNKVVQMPERILSDYKAEQANLRALQDEQVDQQTARTGLSKLKVRYNELRRYKEKAEKQHGQVLERLNEMIVLTASTEATSKFQIQQYASLPEQPVSPEKKKIAAIALFCGLFFGFGLAFVFYALDTSLKTVEEAETFLRLPLLGAVPLMSGVQAGKKEMVMTTGAETVGAESFRSLRTTLAMLGPSEQRRTYLFTSAIPNEGKTFCSLNYALSLAQQGLNTLLIDADLRCPSVATCLYGKDPGSEGVSNFLSGQKKFKELVLATELESLSFLPAGTRCPNPAELLSQPSFGVMIEEALKHFDRVVIDSAPVHPVSDTLLLVRHVNTVCFVVRAGKTNRKVAMHAVQKLHKASAPTAGIILNCVSRRGEGYYGGYSDYYKAYAAKGTEKA